MSSTQFIILKYIEIINIKLIWINIYYYNGSLYFNGLSFQCINIPLIIINPNKTTVKS